MATVEEDKMGLLAAANGSTDSLPQEPSKRQGRFIPFSKRSIRLPRLCVQNTFIIIILLLALIGSVAWVGYRLIALPQSDLGVEQRFDLSSLRKPHGTKVVGILFYGRRQFFDILDCYLRRNLASNGGFLDEVHFLLHDTDKADEDYLRAMMKAAPELRHQYILYDYKNSSYTALWEHCNEMNTMYVKMDDDVIYVHDDAIPRLVTTLMRHPEAHSMQANVVNSARTHWNHLHTDAVRAYVPDFSHGRKGVESWRASMLPLFEGPIDDNMHFNSLPKGHRWLPLKLNNAERFEKTPLYKEAQAPDGEGMMRANWYVGAQELYSLLHNIEENQLDRYWFGSREGIWNPWYKRYNINMMAIWGRNLWMKKFWEDEWKGDERHVSMLVPQALHMPLKVDTHAIIGHFSFSTQMKGMLTTDLLDRFRLYANEKVCASDNQKKAFDVLPG